jgi:SAM-dependent methyltransferase
MQGERGRLDDLRPRYGDDAFARAYQHLAVPAYFAPAALDLVTELGLVPGESILDVGSGTGVVLSAARIRTGGKGTFVAVDASRPMLRLSDAQHRALARVPGLPFEDGRFHVVTAGFVLSHVPDPGRILVDMIRVLRPGGRLGVTAWGTNPNPAMDLWLDLAGAIVSRDRLEAIVLEGLPSEAFLSDTTRLHDLLSTCGLVRVTVQRRIREAVISVAEFLDLRETSGQGALVIQAAGPSGWSDFRSGLARTFRERFGDRIVHPRDFLVGCGWKPERGS